jgi:hypothetical protein
MKLGSNARKDIRSRCEDADPQQLPDEPDPGAKFQKKRKRQSGVSRDGDIVSQPKQVTSLSDIADIFGSPDQHMQVQDTIKRLYAQGHNHSLLEVPEKAGLPLMSQVNADYFLKGLPGLRKCIEGEIICQQITRTRSRITIAHFYHAYTLAKDNPVIFLELTQQHHYPLRRTRMGSMMRQRVIDITFSEPESRQKASKKIDDWNRLGKPWWEFIKRFGCETLIIVPKELPDET